MHAYCVLKETQIILKKVLACCQFWPGRMGLKFRICDSRGSEHLCKVRYISFHYGSIYLKLSLLGPNFLQIPHFWKPTKKIHFLFSRSGFLSGILRSEFSKKNHLKTRFYKIRNGIFKWVYKSGICRKLWPYRHNFQNLKNYWFAWTMANQSIPVLL